MSFTQSHAASEAAVPEEIILEWQVHLALRQPARAALVFGILALALLVGIVFVRSPFIVIAICLGLFSSVAEFLLPIHYRLTTRGAYSRHFLTPTFIEWQRVRKVYLGADGMKLSPLPKSSRLEAFRGVTLRFGADNRERVIEEVKKWREIGRKKS